MLKICLWITIILLLLIITVSYIIFFSPYGKRNQLLDPIREKFLKINEQIKNNKKDYIFILVKSILIIILSFWVVPLLCIVLLFGVVDILFGVRFPDAELKRALEFMEDEQYIGMTLEECEEIFGESNAISPAEKIVYPAGYFRWGWSESYEIHIYFDEDERVREVRLQEERDI